MDRQMEAERKTQGDVDSGAASKVEREAEGKVEGGREGGRKGRKGMEEREER